MRIWSVDAPVAAATPSIALVADDRHGLLGSSGNPVDAEDVRAFAGEQHRHRATVAHRLARRLPGPDHDRMLAEQSFTHARRT